MLMTLCSTAHDSDPTPTIVSPNSFGHSESCRVERSRSDVVVVRSQQEPSGAVCLLPGISFRCVFFPFFHVARALHIQVFVSKDDSGGLRMTPNDSV